MRRSCTVLTVSLLLLLASSMLVAQVSHRPIEDFISAQENLTFWMALNSPYWGVLDIAGVNNRYLLIEQCGVPGFGPTFNGDITEKALADGRTQVHIVLQGKNAFMRSFLGEDGTPVIGHGFAEVCYYGAPAMLGHFTLVVDLISNQPVGGALPDLGRILSGEGGVVTSLLVDAYGQGLLREYFELPAESMGFLRIVQRTPLANWHATPGRDYWPAEIVEVKPIGR
ncbi:MAG TPA: hypothetical protein VN577_18040 [Terriglobales bacterium]|nr:hypothetical protein [Terriglobales bacterium]